MTNRLWRFVPLIHSVSLAVCVQVVGTRADGNPPCTRVVGCLCSLRLAGADGQVVLHYKELAVQPVWLPPVDPHADKLVTDPDGIVLFSSPPPYPMQSPPAEIPLFARCTECAAE